MLREQAEQREPAKARVSIYRPARGISSFVFDVALRSPANPIAAGRQSTPKPSTKTKRKVSSEVNDGCITAPHRPLAPPAASLEGKEMASLEDGRLGGKEGRMDGRGTEGRAEGRKEG